MTERTKNILTIALSIIIFILISGFLVIAWELRETQNSLKGFQWAIDSIKSLDSQISSNSAEFESIEEKKKNLTERQWELHELNKSLRAERDEAQTQFLSGLWLLPSSQAQSKYQLQKRLISHNLNRKNLSQFLLLLQLLHLRQKKSCRKKRLHTESQKALIV